MERQVTYDDIAKYTGFSKTTISRYFNKPDTVTPENQERIRNAMVELGYRENKVAKILAKGKTEFLGILLPNLSMHYFSEMLNQLLLTYEEFGYKFLVFTGNENESIEKRYLDELRAYQIEGLIVMSHTIPSEELATLPFPVVCIEREDRYISSVNCDNYMGGIQAASLLAKRGCDVFIHINSVMSEFIPAYQRLQGFSDFCHQYNLEHKIILEDLGVLHSSIGPGIASILEQIERDYPTQRKGVFLSDDTRANEFLNCLLRKYGTFPESYRIVGFDNSPVSESAVFPISTVGQQIDKIAHETVSLLVQQIEQKKTEPSLSVTHRIITPVLFKRATTEMYNSGWIPE